MVIKIKNHETGYELTLKDVRELRTVGNGEYFVMTYQDGVETTAFETAEWEYEVLKAGIK